MVPMLLPGAIVPPGRLSTSGAVIVGVPLRRPPSNTVTVCPALICPPLLVTTPLTLMLPKVARSVPPRFSMLPVELTSRLPKKASNVPVLLAMVPSLLIELKAKIVPALDWIEPLLLKLRPLFNKPVAVFVTIWPALSKSRALLMLPELVWIVLSLIRFVAVIDPAFD
jgi:hypothetical protein